jgi:hypothetical protein
MIASSRSWNATAASASSGVMSATASRIGRVPSIRTWKRSVGESIMRASIA